MSVVGGLELRSRSSVLPWLGWDGIEAASALTPAVTKVSAPAIVAQVYAFVITKAQFGCNKRGESDEGSN